MKKATGMKEQEFLDLLQKVLPKTIRDTHLANTIYEEVAKEVRLRNHLSSFEKFCRKGSITDLEPATVTELQRQLTEQFGEESVVLTPNEEDKSLGVEIMLPDRLVSEKIKVVPPGEEDELPEAPFVPFPVALPEDPDLVWLLARKENFGPDEAARSLASIEEEFWATKAGQKLLREVGERTFADFIAHVPASALAESGMKRHYKAPETLKTLRPLPSSGEERLEAAEAE